MPPISEALAVGLQHHQGGRLQAAEQIYRQILQAEPNHADAIHLLGLIAYQAGKYEVAADFIARAIKLNGDAADFHYHLAKVDEALHRLPEAVASYRRALELAPEFAGARHNLGNALMEQGQLPAAADCFRRALDLQPDFFGAHNNLGNALKRLGRLEEAIVCYRRALELKPDFAEAHSNLGNALLKGGSLDEAILCYRRALEIKPDFAEALHNLGSALKDLGKLEEAVACFRLVLQLKPDFAEGHSNLGLAFMDESRQDQAGLNEAKIEQAAACFRRALELKPDFAEALLGLGNAVRDLGDWDRALDCYRRALELAPAFALAHNNLGLAFMDEGKLDEAAACFRRAVELDPGLADARNNIGIHLLLHGRYDEGWREYEHRLACLKTPRKFPTPRWNGERAEGRTILIHREQGFGDMIQFARYAPLVRERSGAAGVLLETPPELARLFARNTGWDAEVISRLNSTEPFLPSFDSHVPLLSLPLALGLSEPLPMTHEYIAADPTLRRAWRERLGETSAIRVGLAWAGNPGHKGDRLRSMPGERLLPLLRLTGFRFYSLQARFHRRQAEPLAEAGLIDLTMHIADFADTAAFIAELDLVISVNTAIAHLAGAMGRPVWTLLPFQAEWRWGLAGDRTPWYSTMRLFRQPVFGDWDGVVRRVGAELPLARTGAGRQ